MTATVLRSGRTVAQVRTALVSGGETCVEALVSVGALDGDVWWDGVPAVELPLSRPARDCRCRARASRCR